MKKYKQALDIALLFLLIIISLGLISMFLVLVWREKPSDEREAENQQLASRMAYLAGCIVLIIVMLAQGISHNLDAAVPITLLIMILTKIVTQQLKDKK